MMNSNNMDAAQHQKLMQMQQLASNAGQTAITNETQGRVAMEGMQRVNELSASQKTQELFRGSEALMLHAMNSGQNMKKFADPNFKGEVGRSLDEQSRLKGMLS